jgi:biopolymer transport protein ExbB
MVVSQIRIEGLTDFLGMVLYAALGMAALWGLFSLVMLWRRVAAVRFRSEQAQSEFLSELEQALAARNFAHAEELCRDDPRAVPQLALLALENRQLGYAKLRHLVVDRFQHDVLSDMEYRASWVQTVIKAAPMLGLLGTVVGMMGAFANLSSGQRVDTVQLSRDISLALITTAIGLSIAIPLLIASAGLNVRIRKMEDLVALGLTRFFEALKFALGEARPQAADGRQLEPVARS